MIGNEVKTKLSTYHNIFDITDSISNIKGGLIIELNRQNYILEPTRFDVIQQISNASRCHRHYNSDKFNYGV